MHAPTASIGPFMSDAATHLNFSSGKTGFFYSLSVSSRGHGKPRRGPHRISSGQRPDRWFHFLPPMMTMRDLAPQLVFPGQSTSEESPKAPQKAPIHAHPITIKLKLKTSSLLSYPSSNYPSFPPPPHTPVLSLLPGSGLSEHRKNLQLCKKKTLGHFKSGSGEDLHLLH